MPQEISLKQLIGVEFSEQDQRILRPEVAVYAMGHCSVIACELFLKSVISWSYYHAEEGNNETLFPQSGTMYIVKPKVVSGFKNFTSEFDARWKCMETCERLCKRSTGKKACNAKERRG